MKIIFFNENKEELTYWENYLCVPNVGDEVVLKIYPKLDDKQWFDTNDPDNGKLIPFIVKKRQWKEENIVLLIVNTDNN